MLALMHQYPQQFWSCSSGNQIFGIYQLHRVWWKLSKMVCSFQLQISQETNQCSIFCPSYILFIQIYINAQNKGRMWICLPCPKQLYETLNANIILHQTNLPTNMQNLMASKVNVLQYPGEALVQHIKEMKCYR